MHRPFAASLRQRPRRRSGGTGMSDRPIFWADSAAWCARTATGSDRSARNEGSLHSVRGPRRPGGRGIGRGCRPAAGSGGRSWRPTVDVPGARRPGAVKSLHARWHTRRRLEWLVRGREDHRRTRPRHVARDRSRASPPHRRANGRRGPASQVHQPSAKRRSVAAPITLGQPCPCRRRRSR